MVRHKKHFKFGVVGGHTPLTAKLFSHGKPVRLPTSPVTIRGATHSNAPIPILTDFWTGNPFIASANVAPNLLPNWLNKTPVEQGGFKGDIQNRKSVYDVYGEVYHAGKFYPPGWFGYTPRGEPIEVSSIGSGAKAHGAMAITAEERILAKYPFADLPPNFAWNYYKPAHGGKPPGSKQIIPVFPDPTVTKLPVKQPTKVITHVI